MPVRAIWMTSVFVPAFTGNIVDTGIIPIVPVSGMEMCEGYDRLALAPCLTWVTAPQVSPQTVARALTNAFTKAYPAVRALMVTVK